MEVVVVVLLSLVSVSGVDEVVAGVDATGAGAETTGAGAAGAGGLPPCQWCCGCGTECEVRVKQPRITRRGIADPKEYMAGTTLWDPKFVLVVGRCISIDGNSDTFNVV